MNGYIGFFNGKQVEVFAENMNQAKLKAVEHFKPARSKAHMVSVVLCELAGVQVNHVADF